MKRALLAATAVVSTVFAPVPMITVAAHAANPTLADAQTVCNDLYVTNQADPSLWKAEVTDFHSEDGQTTQVDGSERLHQRRERLLERRARQPAQSGRVAGRLAEQYG